MIIGSLVWDPMSRARLNEATLAEAHIHVCDKQSELVALVRNGLAHVVVLDICDRVGESTLPTVRLLRDEYPTVPVILYCAMASTVSREMLEFARAGVSDLILRDVDDVRATLRASLSVATDHNSARSLLAELDGLIPPSVAPIFRYCLENGRRALTVEQVATALNVHRKTLVDRLNAVGFPSPSAVIAWCRLLVSARLLEDPGRSVEQVALLLDFPSGTSMRNMVKRYTGLPPGEVRENGGLRCVLHALKHELVQGPKRQIAS